MEGGNMSQRDSSEIALENGGVSETKDIGGEGPEKEETIIYP